MVALKLGRSTYFQWKKKYQEHGLDGLKVRPLPGAASKLTDQQTSQLRMVGRARSAAVPVRFRVVDPPDRAGSHPSAVRRRDDPARGGETVAPARVVAAAAAVPRLPAEPGGSPAVEAGGVPGNPGTGTARRVPKCTSVTSRGCGPTTTPAPPWPRWGSTLVVEVTGERKSVNMISAVSPGGTLHFEVFFGSWNATVFVEFLKKLMHDAPGPVYLILDNVSFHKAPPVKDTSHRSGPVKAVLPARVLARTQPRRVGLEECEARRHQARRYPARVRAVRNRHAGIGTPPAAPGGHPGILPGSCRSLYRNVTPELTSYFSPW